MPTSPLTEGDGRSGVSHHFSGLRRTDSDSHRGRRRASLAVGAGAILLAAGCTTSVSGRAAVNSFIDTGGGSQANQSINITVPANQISLVDGGQPQPITIETTNGLPITENVELAELTSTDTGAHMGAAFETEAAGGIGADEIALYDKLSAYLDEPHPFAVKFGASLYPLGSTVLGSGVILDVNGIKTVDPPPAASRTNALGQMRLQRQTTQRSNQIYGYRPRSRV